MRIAIASDHAGFAYKTLIIAELQRLGHQVHDFGTSSDAPCDYPIYIRPAAEAVASGECSVALSNTYYIARLMRSNKPDDRQVMEQVGVIFPNQQSWGTHVNVAGGAVARHAKNRAAAISFLEYLASDEAQRYFADGNNEYPSATGVKTANPALEALGSFKQELIPISVVGQNTVKVQQMLDRVGYK